MRSKVTKILRDSLLAGAKEVAMKIDLKLLLMLVLTFMPLARAEFRSAKDMQKECRIALDVLQDHVEKTAKNFLYTGECVGYIQGAVDSSMALADNVDWYKVCVPDDVKTETLIRKFILFVDKYPQYTLASTAIAMMLADEYACPASPKKKNSK